MNQFYNQGYSQQPLNSPSAHLREYLKRPIIFALGAFSLTSLLISIITLVITQFFPTYFQASLTVTVNGSASQTGTIIAYVILFLFSLLSPIAFIMMYCMAKKNKNPRPAVTILQVTSIISLVFTSIFILLYTICMIVMFCAKDYMTSQLFINDYYYYNSSGMAFDTLYTMMCVLFVVLEIALIFGLVYNICQVRLAFSVKSILNDRSTKINGATYIGVINIIMAVMLGISFIFFSISLIALFATISYVPTTHTTATIIVMILLVITMLISIIYAIMTAVAAFGVKSHMNRFNGYFNTPQTPTGYYNDGFSNYDNTSFNPYQNNGYSNNNTGYNPYQNNDYSNNNTGYNPYQGNSADNGYTNNSTYYNNGDSNSYNSYSDNNSDNF